MSTRIGFKVRGWDVEAYADWHCLMIGVNWSWDALRSFYVHVGPIIIGAHRWEKENELAADVWVDRAVNRTLDRMAVDALVGDATWEDAQ